MVADVYAYYYVDCLLRALDLIGEALASAIPLDAGLSTPPVHAHASVHGCTHICIHAVIPAPSGVLAIGPFGPRIPSGTTTLCMFVASILMPIIIICLVCLVSVPCQPSI